MDRLSFECLNLKCFSDDVRQENSIYEIPDGFQEYCLRFIVKEGNYNQIVMSREFETLDQPLMVEIIRRKQMPSVRMADPQPDPVCSEFVFCHF